MGVILAIIGIILLLSLCGGLFFIIGGIFEIIMAGVFYCLGSIFSIFFFLFALYVLFGLFGLI